MVPTVTAVTPSSGHTGGCLVQIDGTGFQLPPALTGEVPEPIPPATVRVFFGTTEVDADKVEIWGADMIVCQSPILDPIESAANASVAGAVWSSTGHPFQNDQIVRLEVETGDPRVMPVMPAPFKVTSAYYVVGRSTNAFGLAATIGGLAIVATDAAIGTVRAVTEGSVDVTVRNVDANGATIGAETATLSKSFSPVRPNLAAESHLATTVAAFIGELRRQIVKNVSWTTNTDYDDTTGDMMSIAFVPKLPALIVAKTSFPRNAEAEQTEDHETGDPDTSGSTATTRPPKFVNFIGTIVGVADRDAMLLNLLQATSGFFEKNPTLRVPRDVDDAAAGYVEYDMGCALESHAAVTNISDNNNLQFFSLEFYVSRIRLEVIPGLPRETVPGVPASIIAESVIGVGRTAEGADIVVRPLVPIDS